MQFLAALELGDKEHGVRRFHLQGKDGSSHAVEADKASDMLKLSGRLPRKNVFGPLSQTWIYDRDFSAPDRANRIGWVLHRAAEDESPEQTRQALLGRAWDMTGRLSPVALLDVWRSPIQEWCLEKRAYEPLEDPLYPPLGGLRAMRVSITDHFLRFVSQGVREHELTV
jgi:hypothetical protein